MKLSLRGILSAECLPFHHAGFVDAAGRARTGTGYCPLAPQASTSTNSITAAFVALAFLFLIEYYIDKIEKVKPFHLNACLAQW